MGETKQKRTAYVEDALRISLGKACGNCGKVQLFHNRSVESQIPRPFIHTVFSEYSPFFIHHKLCYVTARRVLLFDETASKSSKTVERNFDLLNVL